MLEWTEEDDLLWEMGLVREEMAKDRGIPMIPVPDEEDDQETEMLYKWGSMHRDWLKKAQPKLYKELEETGELFFHCKDREEEAEEMVRMLTEKAEKKEPLPKEPWLLRVQKMEQRRREVEEIVKADLIYSL